MYSLYKLLEDGSKELVGQSENRESLESEKNEDVIYSLEVSTDQHITVLY